MLRYILCFSLLCFVGCQSNTKPLPEGAPPLFPATAKVTYKGSPLADALVVFAPKSGKIGGSGKTDANGLVQLQAYPPHEGLPAGEYQVMITKSESVEVPGGDPDNKQTKTNFLIPQKYGNPAKSGLNAAVMQQADQEFTFELKD